MQALPKPQAPRPPTTQPYSLPAPFYGSTETQPTRQSVTVAYKPPACDRPYATKRASTDGTTHSANKSGKAKTAANAAFLGESGRYRHKRVNCCRGNTTTPSQKNYARRTINLRA